MSNSNYGVQLFSIPAVQFRMKDVVFFIADEWGKLKQLPRNASDEEIMNAQCPTLRLDNQKNGWRNVCVNQHHNGDDIFCGVRGLGRRYIHIRKHMRNNWNTNLSAVWDEKGKRMDVTDKCIRNGLKLAATALNYPELRGIPNALIRCTLAEPTRYTLPATATARSRRWAAGAATPSNSMSESSSRSFPRVCLGK
jgi:hypothetical protein